MTPFHTVAGLQDDCTRLCEQLLSCLEREKRNLIEFKIDEVHQVNAEKEHLNDELKEIREKLSHALVMFYGVETPERLTSLLAEDEKIIWEKSLRKMDEVWQCARCGLESNLGFIKHSLRNLSLLGDNLKRLLGSQMLYTRQGRKMDIQTEGKVVRQAF